MNQWFDTKFGLVRLSEPYQRINGKTVSLTLLIDGTSGWGISQDIYFKEDIDFDVEKWASEAIKLVKDSISVPTYEQE